ncbi:MAG TPA: hypothetical protein DCG38_08250 [Eubacteriaceae bacterium]|jgi:hypothetical protein|nr:hypothetical protein [Eubacteriaceae bacterium]
MNKKNLLILLVLSVTLGSVLILTFFYHEGLSEDDRTVGTNTAREAILTSGKTYEVGEDIEPGYYDVIYLPYANDYRVIFRGISLSKDDKLLNMPLNRGDEFTLIVEDKNSESKAKLKFAPSSFDDFELDEQEQFTLSHTGYYVVGDDLPAGEYEVQLTSAAEDSYNNNPDVVIYIFTDHSFKEKISNYYFGKVGYSSNIKLVENEVLYLYKIREGLDYEIEGNSTYAMGYEADDLELLFKKK